MERPVGELELVEAARSGSKAAFGQLVEQYQAFAFCSAYALSKSPSLSEEIAQESFLAAWRSLRQMRRPDSFRSWLFGIVRNRSLYLQREERLRLRAQGGALPGDDQIVAPDRSPLDEIIGREDERALRQALGGIPEAYRVPLVLYYGEQLSVSQIGETLGLSRTNVKQRLLRGRRMLQGKVAFVEAALPRLRPRRGFTAGVVAALSLHQLDATAAPCDVPGSLFGTSSKSAWLSPFMLSVAVGSLAVTFAANRGEKPFEVRWPSLARAENKPLGALDVPARSHERPGGVQQRAGRPQWRPSAIDFDFEEGFLPDLFEQGHIVGAPPGSSSRYCVVGTIAPSWPQSSTVTMSAPGKTLMTHAATTFLSFDYWVGSDSYYGADDGWGWQPITIDLWNLDKSLKYQLMVREYVTDEWGHADIPLSAFVSYGPSSRPAEAGDRIDRIMFTAGRAGGKPFYLDNIKVVSASP